MRTRIRTARPPKQPMARPTLTCRSRRRRRPRPVRCRDHTVDVGVDEAVTYAVLAEVARSAGFDLLISEAPAAAPRYLPMHDRMVVVSRAEAVPIIAHYLRRQHIFRTGSRLVITHSRHDYYAEAVHALAPALRGWETRVAATTGVPAEITEEVRSRYLTARSQLARVLECRDDIIWSLGSYLTTPVLEDCMDDFDHLLLLLCGAVDVFEYLQADALLPESGAEADQVQHRAA